MNYYAKYVFVLILLIIFGFFFEKYKKTEELHNKMDQYDLIKKYLLNDSTLARTDKPILWVHVVFETNARWWPHFASRNTQCFNQPYQYLTIKSMTFSSFLEALGTAFRAEKQRQTSCGSISFIL